MTYLSRFWLFIRVQHGAELRLLAAAICLSIGFPRLEFAHHVLAFSPQRFGPPELWGWLFVVVGLALLVTCWRWRFTPAGRIIAGLGAVAFVGLASATTSATSLGVDFLLACALAWEAGTANGH